MRALAACRSTDWQANMAVLSDRAKSRDMPMPAAKPRSSASHRSPTAEEPYQSAVHVNATAVSMAPAAGALLLPQPFLRDPRLPDVGSPVYAPQPQAQPPRSTAQSEHSSFARSPTAGGPPQTPTSLTRTFSDDSMVSATSGRGSQGFASASGSPLYSGSVRSWRGEAFADAEEGDSDAERQTGSLLGDEYVDSATLPRG